MLFGGSRGDEANVLRVIRKRYRCSVCCSTHLGHPLCWLVVLFCSEPYFGSRGDEANVLRVIRKRDIPYSGYMLCCGVSDGVATTFCSLSPIMGSDMTYVFPLALSGQMMQLVDSFHP
ncbi:uncharacterized protein LOC129877874 [Solanum dulcamara]|uniref:uncharacterized protein LOC129877874 n=1 Tax=Solanum dulcamara TaxID=45834 RepID=UPI002484DB5B|nr:uncharacterized protein LOC129877874 [Solanum dulcamara]